MRTLAQSIVLTVKYGTSSSTVRVYDQPRPAYQAGILRGSATAGYTVPYILLGGGDASFP